MNERWRQQLCKFLSTERLAPYVAQCDGDTLAALRLYAWNIEMSAAFQGPIAVLEVVVRNAIHGRLTDLAGKQDWWRTGTRRLLVGQEAARIDDALRVLANRSIPLAPGQMIAELPLGFWTGLLSKRYEVTLWRPTLRLAFPGFTGARASLHNDLYHLRKLRNRIAHHEPIHHRHLSADHASVLRIIEYVAREIADWVRHNDRVPEVLARRMDVCEGAGPTRF